MVDSRKRRKTNKDNERLGHRQAHYDSNFVLAWEKENRIIMKCAWRCSSSHSITSTFRRGDHVSGKPRDVNLFKVDDECLEAVGCYLSLSIVGEIRS